jgi:hypothetical protein
VASAAKLPERGRKAEEGVAREVGEVLREVERLRARLLSLRARAQRELGFFGDAYLARACAHARYMLDELAGWLKDFEELRRDRAR